MLIHNQGIDKKKPCFDRRHRTDSTVYHASIPVKTMPCHHKALVEYQKRHRERRSKKKKRRKEISAMRRSGNARFGACPLLPLSPVPKDEPGGWRGETSTVCVIKFCTAETKKPPREKKRCDVEEIATVGNAEMDLERRFPRSRSEVRERSCWAMTGGVRQ